MGRQAGIGHFPADIRLGIEGKWTGRARKYGCLFRNGLVFERNAEHLNEVGADPRAAAWTAIAALPPHLHSLVRWLGREPRRQLR